MARYKKIQHADVPDKDVDDHIEQNLSKSILDKEELTKEDVIWLIDNLFLPFIDICSPDNLKLYPYQRTMAAGICYNVLFDTGDTTTALWSRQSGKSQTISSTIFGLGLLLPKLGKMCKAKQLKKYQDGFRVGIFGPSYDKSGIIYSRIREIAQGKNAQQVYADPDININIKDIKGLVFPNGFRVDLKTASAGSKVEGDTYDYVIIDEAQDIGTTMITKSIRPMLATSNGSSLYIGTPAPGAVGGEFYQACARNGLEDQAHDKTEDRFRLHYEFTYHECSKYNEFYRKYVGAELKKYGAGSDEMRQAYFCEWVDGKGHFIGRSQLSECGITKTRTDKATIGTGAKEYVSTFKRPAGLVSSDINTPDQVFSIDYAKNNDSTIITFARVWWDNPIAVGEDECHHIHIHDWIELRGSDYEEQFPEILANLSKFNVSYGINDTTGVGDPIHSRLSAVLRKMETPISLVPFSFNVKSKSDGYRLLKRELVAKRITFPASSHVSKYEKHRAFLKQVRELSKEHKNGFDRYEAPKGKNFHDDYPDSLMMLSWLVNKEGRRKATASKSPLREQRFKTKRRYSKFDGRSIPKKRFWR